MMLNFKFDCVLQFIRIPNKYQLQEIILVSKDISETSTIKKIMTFYFLVIYYSGKLIAKIHRYVVSRINRKPYKATDIAMSRYTLSFNLIWFITLRRKEDA